MYSRLPSSVKASTVLSPIAVMNTFAASWICSRSVILNKKEFDDCSFLQSNIKKESLAELFHFLHKTFYLL